MKNLSSYRTRQGFTIVELLTAIAVLSILVVLISEMLSGAAKTVGNAENGMDDEAQVRTVFATMANDFGHLLRRADAECIMTKKSGGLGHGANDYMYFNSEVPGYFDPTVALYSRSTLSVIGYRVNANYQLERFAKGLTWDDSTNNDGSVSLTYNSSSATPISSSTMESKWSAEIPQDLPPAVPAVSATPPAYYVNYQVVASHVFRMEICFQLTDGTISDQPYTAANGSTHVNGLQDVSAVIVTLAAVDDKSRNIINNLGATKMANLSQTFGDSGINTAAYQPFDGSNIFELPATAWNTTMGKAGFAGTVGIPVPIASQIKVYQHFFYLNKF